MDFIEEFLKSGTIFSLGDNKVVIGYGSRSWSKNPKKNQALQFYFPDYFLTEKEPWYTQTNHANLSYSDFIKLLEPYTADETKLVWKNSYQKTFEMAFADLKDRFKSKELQKAVPYIMETSETKMSQSLLAKSLLSMLKCALTYPLHLYGFWENGQGMLGATPEVLFTIESNQTLHTMACAGTMSSRHASGDSLLQDQKECKEHDIVVQSITEALSPFGIVYKNKIEISIFPGLAHLVTPIRVNLQGQHSLEQLVTALHPTPALGAFPKEAGHKWLRHYQTLVERHRYGAPAGMLDSNSTRCFVAIRNVQWNEKGLKIGAGCGVVQESKLEHEWQEIQTKLSAIKKMLNL